MKNKLPLLTIVACYLLFIGVGCKPGTPSGRKKTGEIQHETHELKNKKNQSFDDQENQAGLFAEAQSTLLEENKGKDGSLREENKNAPLGEIEKLQQDVIKKLEILNEQLKHDDYEIKYDNKQIYKNNLYWILAELNKMKNKYANRYLVLLKKMQTGNVLWKIDRIHHKNTLNAIESAIASINALQLEISKNDA